MDRKIEQACDICGKIRNVRLRNGKAVSHMCKSCAGKLASPFRVLKMENHPQWKGGRIRTREGYIEIRLAPSDFFYPMVQRHNGYVLEHRLIKAQHLGRCLMPWEVVHHKNGIKDDNRVENLQILPSSKYHLVDSITKRKLMQQQEEICQLQKDILIQQRLIIWMLGRIQARIPISFGSG